MHPTVTPEKRQAAKRQMIEQIEQGASVRQARSHSAVPMHRATVYRLLKGVRAEGEAAYTDQRHGHSSKVRGEVRAFLIEMCQTTPSVSSPAVQHAIHERFGLAISVSQLNRVRASLGLSRRRMPREKKSSPPRPSEPEWQEGAGGLLLLAAATETKLIADLCEALPTESTTTRPPLAGSSAALRRRLLLTLLFLGAFGLQRTWDLRGYTAAGLALLTGRLMREADSMQVELRPFNDRQLNRDLAEVCARVNQLQPALPDGRCLVLSVSGPTLLDPHTRRHDPLR